jgi:hypothetical protein
MRLHSYFSLGINIAVLYNKKVLIMYCTDGKVAKDIEKPEGLFKRNGLQDF